MYLSRQRLGGKNMCVLRRSLLMKWMQRHSPTIGHLFRQVCTNVIHNHLESCLKLDCSNNKTQNWTPSFPTQCFQPLHWKRCVGNGPFPRQMTWKRPVSNTVFPTQGLETLHWKRSYFSLGVHETQNLQKRRFQATVLNIVCRASTSSTSSHFERLCWCGPSENAILSTLGFECHEDLCFRNAQEVYALYNMKYLCPPPGLPK